MPSTVRDLMVAPSPDAKRAGRFSEFQSWVLCEGCETLPIHRLLIACLIAFDGTWTRAQLHIVLRRAHLWVDLSGTLAASWTQEGVTQRRIVSHFTATCWRALTRTDCDWDRELTQLGIDYRQQIPGNLAADQIVEDVLLRGRHWASLVLPPLLAVHLDGAVVLSAVPDEVWVRQDGLQIASGDAKSDPPMPEDHGELLYQFAADGKSKTGQWFLDRLKAAFSDCVGPGVNLSNERARRRLSDNLLPLNTELAHAGVPGLLLFGWVQDLLVHGSARATAPAIQTLRNYVNVGGTALMGGMNAADDVMDMEVDAWKALYEAAQLMCSETQLRVLNPAMASFHRYLVRALDVDPISGGLFAGEDALPVASVLWPHEIENAYCILRSIPMEERLKAQAVVILTLLKHTSLRRAEISTLRICSFRFIGNSAIVEVSPKRSHRSLKSSAARRRLVISDAQACSVLREWTNRRHSEAAAAGDLLFGDPHRPEQLYVMGNTYSILMRALKNASGDPAIGWHTCRHSYASSRLCAALLDGQVRSISPLHRLQRAMGHAHLMTTLQTYCHLYEAPLRAHLDAAFCGHVTSRQLQNWTGEAASTIRQRKRRTGVNGPAYIDMAFGSQSVPDPSQPDTASAMGAHLGGIDGNAEDHLSPMGMVNILSDIQTGLCPMGICSANGISERILRRVCGLILSDSAMEPEALDTLVAKASSSLQYWSLSRLNEPRWQKVLSCLQMQSERESRALVSAWSKHGAQEGLSVVVPDEVGPVLGVLAKAGFMASQMRLRIARPHNAFANSRRVLEQEEFIRLAVADSFGDNVLVELLKPRRGRPSAFVVPLTRAGVGTPAPPATVDTKSLHAVMYTYLIFFDLETSS